MYHRVDQALQPRVLRHEGNVCEPSDLRSQRPSGRLEPLNLSACLKQEARYRAFEPPVFEELLSRTASSFAPSVAQHPHESLRKKALRILGEKQYACDRQLLSLRESSSLEKTKGIWGGHRAGVALGERVIQ